MNALSIARPAPTNGHHATLAPPLSAVTLGGLATSIDTLAELRAEKRRLDTAERTLTAEVMAAMEKAGLPALRAARSVATLTERHELTVDPVLFIEAVGGAQPAAPALRVSVEKARGLLGDDVLRAIAETRTVPTLRVEPLAH